MNSSRYGTIQKATKWPTKIFTKFRSLSMEHLFGLTMSGIFIAIVVFSVWYMLTLSERGEPTDE
jgi:hypothetical protein